jgi:hypothetical protein
MIELKILDIYIPIDLPYKKDKISITTKVQGEVHHLSTNNRNPTIFTEEVPCFNLDLFHDDLKLSSTSEAFDFLKTSNKLQDLDDWVKFEVLKSLKLETSKFIRVRFSGKYLVTYRKLPTIASIKSLDQVSEKSEHFEESSHSDNSIKSLPYQREFNCHYIKNISKIEFCYKSIDCAVKRISCYDAIDFYSPDHESGEMVFIPCKLDHSNELLHISHQRELEFLKNSVDLKWKFVELQLEKRNILKKISDTQEDRRDKMKEARRSLKNDFIENIRNLENFLDDLNEQNVSISNLFASLETKNEEMIKEKNYLEEELKSLSIENEKLKKLQKSNSEELKGDKDTRELLQNFNKSLESYSKISKEFELKISKLNSEISELIQEGRGLDIEVEDLKNENNRLKNLLSAEQQTLDENESFESKNHFNPVNFEELSKAKRKINQESSDLIKKISQSSKSLKISGFSLQKSLDSLPNSTLTKSPKQSSIQKPQFPAFPSKLLSSYLSLTSHKKNLNSLELDLHKSFESLSLFSSVTEKLLTIQDLQSSLYTKIACELKPVYNLENDQIDMALSSFLNQNRSLFDFSVQKKSYGVYTFGSRVVHLCEHNGHLVVKSGGGLTPIKSFFLDLKRRSKSLAKS